MRFSLVILALVALQLAWSCSASAAAVTAPSREFKHQQLQHPAAAAAADSSHTASLLPSSSTCSADAHMLVVAPADVDFWLSLPLTANNIWLSALPADVERTLSRSGVQDAAVMCVPEQQREAVQQHIDSMQAVTSFISHQGNTDAPESEPTDPRYLRLKALQQRFAAGQSREAQKKECMPARSRPTVPL